MGKDHVFIQPPLDVLSLIENFAPKLVVPGASLLKAHVCQGAGVEAIDFTAVLGGKGLGVPGVTVNHCSPPIVCYLR